MTTTLQRTRNATRLADASAVLQSAERKLALAVAAFTPWPAMRFNGYEFEIVPGQFSDSFTLQDVRQARRDVHQCLKLLRVMGAARSTPRVSWRILDTLEGYANREQQTTPHLEGAYLAIKLAERIVGERSAVSVVVRAVAYNVEQGLFFRVDEMVLDQVLGTRRVHRGR